MGIDFTSVKYPVRDLGIDSVGTSSDIHPHTSYTDGSQRVGESVDEAMAYGLWEKGAIEHGNPLDEDINHITGFLKNIDDSEPFTSTAVYTLKYRNLQEIMDDKQDGRVLNDADTEKVREDIDTLREFEENREDAEESVLNYQMVIPHGVELDYNPAIEASEDEQEAVNSYEEGIIDFLREAESLNAGFNYILGSSHYVNTPFEPRYVKKDRLFRDLDQVEKAAVLENYRKKEIYKINSLSEKLDGMKVPRISGELMTSDEREDLKAFIYGHKDLEGDPDSFESNRDITEKVVRDLDIERPGVIVVGAHPTLIERNEELMDVFRADEGLPTREDISDEVREFIYDAEVSGLESEVDISEVLEDEVRAEDVDGLLSKEDFADIYPGKALKEFYRPMIEASEDADNFIFEINGKGVERQVPSVFWYMLDENVFGSDAHRSMESPDRLKTYSDFNFPGDNVLLTEKWLEQLESGEDIEIEDEEPVKPSRRKIEA